MTNWTYQFLLNEICNFHEDISLFITVCCLFKEWNYSYQLKRAENLFQLAGEFKMWHLYNFFSLSKKILYHGKKRRWHEYMGAESEVTYLKISWNLEATTSRFKESQRKMFTVRETNLYDLENTKRSSRKINKKYCLQISLTFLFIWKPKSIWRKKSSHGEIKICRL